MSQAPSVGRVVHFLPPFVDDKQPRAGLIVAVNTAVVPNRPTVVYWDPFNGTQHVAHDVTYSESLEPDRWTWPPRV